jgi:hypothetical protein
MIFIVLPTIAAKIRGKKVVNYRDLNSAVARLHELRQEVRTSLSALTSRYFSSSIVGLPFLEATIVARERNPIGARTVTTAARVAMSRPFASLCGPSGHPRIMGGGGSESFGLGSIAETAGLGLRSTSRNSSSGREEYKVLIVSDTRKMRPVYRDVRDSEVLFAI